MNHRRLLMMYIANIGFFIIVGLGLDLRIGSLSTDLATCEEERENTEAAWRQKAMDRTVALKAAQYLAEHDSFKDYASRGEPEIRLCVPSYGDCLVARVQQCMPGEHEAIFPISYVDADHHPELGHPTVDSRPFDP